jgi:hypothetical protein
MANSSRSWPGPKRSIEAAQVAEESGDPWSPNNQRCLVAGFVRAIKGNYPWSLIVTDKAVVALFEEDNRVSLIPFKSRHSNVRRPTWYGDPIARWEGDTLVIDTIGFNHKTPFPMAIYHMPALHTVERIRLINGGDQMEDRVTIDDPEAFSRPWESRIVFDRVPATYKLRDYRCAEDNRDLPTTGLWGPD